MRKQTNWLIFILAISVAQSQDLINTLNLASYHLERNELTESESLYRRVAFFDSLRAYQEETLEGLAYIHYLKSDFEQSAGYFLSLYRVTENPGYFYNYVLAILKERNWLIAKSALLGFRPMSSEGKVSKEIFLGLIEFNLKNFERSKGHFSKAESLLDVSLDDEAIFKETQRINRKNKIKAIIMSGFLPGLGQVYSKHYKEGLNSFLLVGTIGVVYYYTMINIGILDSLISVLPWLNRYYVGGMNLAADLVDNHKEDQFNVEYNKLVKLFGQYIGK